MTVVLAWFDECRSAEWLAYETEAAVRRARLRRMHTAYRRKRR